MFCATSDNAPFLVQVRLLCGSYLQFPGGTDTSFRGFKKSHYLLRKVLNDFSCLQVFDMNSTGVLLR